MSLQMHETLKNYILRERRRKKEEDVANEQKMREEMVILNIKNIIIIEENNLINDLNVEKSRDDNANSRTDQRTTASIRSQT